MSGRTAALERPCLAAASTTMSYVRHTHSHTCAEQMIKLKVKPEYIKADGSDGQAVLQWKMKKDAKVLRRILLILTLAMTVGLIP